jgi:hypothetical protein
MIRKSMIALLLVFPISAIAAGALPPAPASVVAAAPALAPAAASALALPPMYFSSSIAEDDLLAAFKATPAFFALDKELVGSPLQLRVTHTVRPTAGGQAAGLLSAILSGSTLGLLPVVTNDRFVVKYEVWLNGTPIAECSFERTATHADNIWTAPKNDAGLGKDGLEWLKSTARESAAKLAQDPALVAVRSDVAFYFPPQEASTTN